MLPYASILYILDQLAKHFADTVFFHSIAQWPFIIPLAIQDMLFVFTLYERNTGLSSWECGCTLVYSLAELTHEIQVFLTLKNNLVKWSQMFPGSPTFSPVGHSIETKSHWKMQRSLPFLPMWSLYAFFMFSSILPLCEIFHTLTKLPSKNCTVGLIIHKSSQLLFTTHHTHW